MMASKSSKLTVSVKRHPLARTGNPHYDKLWIGTVELPSTKVYSCTFDIDQFDGDEVTEGDVLEAWRKHRNWFRPGY